MESNSDIENSCEIIMNSLPVCKVRGISYSTFSAIDCFENGKAKKVVVFKYKAKKNERKKQGHRQPYTKIKIEKISQRASSKKAAAGTEEAAE